MTEHESNELPDFLPSTFKLHTQPTPDPANIHSAHVRRAPAILQNMALPRRPFSTGPVKPTRQVLERNLSSSEEESESDDPVLRQARSQDHIIPPVKPASETSEDSGDDDIDDPDPQKGPRAVPHRA